MTAKKHEVKVTHHAVTHHAAAPVEPAEDKVFKPPHDLVALETMAKSDPARVGRLIRMRFHEAEAKEIRDLILKTTGVIIP